MTTRAGAPSTLHSASPLDAHQFAVKVFARNGEAIDANALVPVFHRWIQGQQTPHLLIDVANYAHVKNGPGVVLIAHEANYAWDESDGQPGLFFLRKRPEQGGYRQRLVTTFRAAFEACARLADDAALQPSIELDPGRFRFSIYNRLVAPTHGDDERALVKDALSDFLPWLYEGRTFTIQTDTRDGVPLGLDVYIEQAPAWSNLLTRLSSA